jgi:Holliday junction resolvasome RuvABC endonuclease subunit
LGTTGWGIIRSGRGQFKYVGSGKISTNPAEPMGRRLSKLFRELQSIAKHYDVTRCAVESGFLRSPPPTEPQRPAAQHASPAGHATKETPTREPR